MAVFDLHTHPCSGSAGSLPALVPRAGPERHTIQSSVRTAGCPTGVSGSAWILPEAAPGRGWGANIFLGCQFQRQEWGQGERGREAGGGQILVGEEEEELLEGVTHLGPAPGKAL